MSGRDPRVDAYIEKSASFAQPILQHIRRLVHAACPEVRETIKWQMPHFERGGILCGMAAFKGHCALFFWKRRLIFGQAETADQAEGHFRRITSMADLPGDATLTSWIKKAAALNEAGIKAPAPAKRTVKKMPAAPADFLAALKKNRQALAAFEKFSPSHKREYLEWITGAKREETRTRRIETALAQLAQHKSLHWKYR